MMRYLSYIILTIMGLTALSAHAAETVKPPHRHAGYVKPGAAISLHHDYDGQTHNGELETLTVRIEHIYQDGFLTAELLSSAKLHINSDLDPFQSHLSAGSNLIIPVQFSSPQDGNYSLAIEVIYEALDGQQSRRVLSIPVTVGTKITEKSSPLMADKAITKSSTGIIALSAQETIK